MTSPSNQSVKNEEMEEMAELFIQWLLQYLYKVWIHTVAISMNFSFEATCLREANTDSR